MMMSSCLSGGSTRAFGLDLDIAKFTSTSTSSRNSHTSASSSPSSTLSESTSNNNTLFSTRKPRTPRKRPNQIYNEAAVLLSSAYPTIFPTKHSKSTANAPPLFLDDSPELLLQTCHRPLPSFNRIIQSFKSEHHPQLATDDDDFKTTSSILDEEMEAAEGIDSIMGVASTEFSEPALSDNGMGRASGSLGFTGLLMRRGVMPLRQVDNGDWWRFPVIDMHQISPTLQSKSQDQKSAAHTKLKKKKKMYSSEAILEDVESEPVILPNLASSLMLKLNYKGVVDAWSDRGSPFDEMPQPPDMSGPNAHEMMLAQIDLFGVREASVLRYKEKRRTRLFSKKIIRYQVRKLNAECRPRMKGRFVTRHNCQTMKKKI